MVPIVHNNDTSDADRRHGFVNTFNTLNKQQNDRKHTLSYDLEREGWQVIDDASAESKHRNKSTEDEDYDEKRHYSESMDSTAAQNLAQKDADIGTVSSDHKNKNKKKKSKKQKKSKKRKASTSSDSSESESDAEK